MQSIGKQIQETAAAIDAHMRTIHLMQTSKATGFVETILKARRVLDDSIVLKKRRLGVLPMRINNMAKDVSGAKPDRFLVASG